MSFSDSIPTLVVLFVRFGVDTSKRCLSRTPTSAIETLSLPASALMMARFILISIWTPVSCYAPYRSLLPHDLGVGGCDQRMICAVWLLHDELLQLSFNDGAFDLVT